VLFTLFVLIACLLLNFNLSQLSHSLFDLRVITPTKLNMISTKVQVNSKRTRSKSLMWIYRVIISYLYLLVSIDIELFFSQ